MNYSARLLSILEAQVFGQEITNIPTFSLKDFDLSTIEFTEPAKKLRLGHLIERAFSALLSNSGEYKILHQNLQVKKHSKTLGEFDFILEHTKTKTFIHLEIAYKFYLFDPTLSSNSLENWIGPNRNDSLIKKLDKLRNHQFPLIQHPSIQKVLSKEILESISQKLCFMASLYVPFEFKGDVGNAFQQLVKGYYLNRDTLFSLDHDEKQYFLPSKLEWGMNPDERTKWLSFQEIERKIKESMMQKQSVLCWEKTANAFQSFFVVWW